MTGAISTATAELSMLQQHRYLDNPGRVWAAVVFNETGSMDPTSLPTASSTWHYSIRVNGSFAGTTDPSLQTVDASNFESVGRNESRKYLWTGAALLQWGVDQSIARVSSGGLRDPSVPDYPQYNKNSATSVSRPHLCFFILFFSMFVPDCLESAFHSNSLLLLLFA